MKRAGHVVIIYMLRRRTSFLENIRATYKKNSNELKWEDAYSDVSSQYLFADVQFLNAATLPASGSNSGLQQVSSSTVYVT
jgi:hypothetical protein